MKARDRVRLDVLRRTAFDEVSAVMPMHSGVDPGVPRRRAVP